MTGCLVSTTSTRLVVSNKGRQGGYSLQDWCLVDESLMSVTLEGV